MSSLRTYHKLFISGAKQELSNPYIIIGRTGLVIVLLWMYFHLWKVIGSANSTLQYPFETYVWYIAITEWIAISVPYFYLAIEEDINDQKIFSALLRPTSFILQKIAECLGIIFIRMIYIGSISFGLTFFLTKIFIFSFQEMVLITISIILSTIIIMLMQGIIGVFAITLKDSAPLYWMWQKAFFIIGGLLVPLFMYPNWLSDFAQFTPFYPILGGVAQIAFHKGDLLASFYNLGIIGFWGLVLSVILFFVYRRGINILLKGDY